MATVDDIIPPECAFLLKDLGFEGKALDFYSKSKTFYEVKNRNTPKENFNDDVVWYNRTTAPTQIQTRLWLIEKFDVHISSKKNPTKFVMHEQSIFNINLLAALKQLIRMELTDEQKESLEILEDQLVLPIGSTKVSIIIMNQLIELNLVEVINVKDREFWSPTK